VKTSVYVERILTDDIKTPTARRKAARRTDGVVALALNPGTGEERRGMADLPTVTPDYFEILVVRELRKVGFEVTEVRIHRRAELPEPEPRGRFVLELLARLGRPAWQKWALIACRRQEAPIPRDVVESLKGRLPDAHAEVALVFSTAPFAPDALAAGGEAGIGLLRVVDGRTALDASGWGGGGGPDEHYPPWLPAYLAQVVDRDGTGQVRTRLLEAGHTELIFDQWPGPEGPPPRLTQEEAHGADGGAERRDGRAGGVA